MRKFFIILAAAALTLSACSKVEIKDSTPDQKITFQTANYVPQTKANEVSFLNEFKAGETPQFNSIAYMYGEGVYREGSTTVLESQYFFGEDGEKIYAYATAAATGAANAVTIPSTGTPTVDHWAPSHDYYWPKSKNSYVDFFSWYDNGIDENNKPLGPTVTPTAIMEWKDRVIGLNDNIMYADPAWHFQQNISTYHIDNTSIVGVPTLFHHALAQIELLVYVASANENETLTANSDGTVSNGTAKWTIQLTDMDLTIKNKGTLSLKSDPPTSSTSFYNQKGTWYKGGSSTDTAPAWVPAADTKNLFLSGTSTTVTPFPVKAIVSTADDAKLLANQSVLPQDLTGVNLTFKLDITTTYITGGQTNQEIIPIEISLPSKKVDDVETGFATGAWAMNTKYIYTIKIIPSENKVLFDPAVEKAWETVTVTPDKEI